MTELRVEVVSDVVCPWCLIGKKRLEDALARRPEIAAQVRFLPFQLDPSTPREGADLRERLAAKYGADPETMFARVEHAARESGIPLDFAKVHRYPNTLAAQVLVVAAESRGTQRALVSALFEAYFLDGADIGDPAVLARVGSRHGFDYDEALALVDDEAAKNDIRGMAREHARRGVSGVPFFVFDGKYAVSGAQSVETFVAVIDRVVKERGEE